MKSLVLGGCGFIGSHLVDSLLAAGNRVCVFDRSPELYREPIANVEYCFGDFDNAVLLDKALEGVDVVYHLISTTVPSTSNLDPIADVQGNLINTLQLLQLMVKNKNRKIVFLSSGGTVYGIPDFLPMSETHPLHPICSYGVTKVAIENYLQMFHYLHGLEYVVLRASNPYGERQGHIGVQGVIGTFIRKILAGDPIEIWGDGSVVRDFIYVADLASLCVHAGQSKVNGIFNAGSGIGYSINDIIARLKSVMGRPIAVDYKDARGYDVPRVTLDVKQANITFGWFPKVDFSTGIALTLQWANMIEMQRINTHD